VMAQRTPRGESALASLPLVMDLATLNTFTLSN